MSAFAVEHRKENVSPTRFVPDTRLVITPVLRTAGFLAMVPDRDMRALLAVLTFLTADGRIQATADQVAQALGISEKNARERLRSLCQLTWQGFPVLVEVPRVTAPTFYAPGRGVVTHAQEELIQESAGESLPYRTASREDLVGQSRERYARPREEVERIVAGQLGHAIAEAQADSPEGETRLALHKLGLTRDEADALLAGYPLEAVRQQLSWLPLREARNPARYLMAAVRGNYAAPKSDSPQRSP